MSCLFFYNTTASAASINNCNLIVNMSASKILQTKLNFLVVGKSGGDYASIQDAIDNAYDTPSNPVTIIIKPGVYHEYIISVGRNISLVGVDKETCIIRNDSGDYYKAPLKISGNGYVSNLTFLATHDDNIKCKIPSYAVQCDSEGAGKLTFYNCKLVSNQNSAVGIGMHQDQTIIFDKCEFIKNSIYGCGSFYCHNDVTSNITNQHLVIKDCHITTSSGVAMRIDDANMYNGGTNSSMDISFYNNILHSEEKEELNVVYFRDISINGGICGQIKLNADSFGNNVSSLNALQ